MKRISIYPSSLDVLGSLNQHNHERRSIISKDGLIIPIHTEYDPYKYREVEHHLSYWATTLHLFKGAIGLGILSLPKRFSEAGMLTGVLFIIFLAVIVWHCMHILFEFQYSICKRLRIPWVSYGDSLDLALQMGPNFLKGFAHHGVSMVHLTIIANELGTTSSYIAFVSTVLQDTLIKLFGEKLNVYYCMLILLIPFLFISYAVDLQKMVPCSILGNIIFCFIFMCICYYIFEDLPSISERNMYTGVTAFPGIFANLMFALECLGVIVTLESQMRKPQQFTQTFGVLNCSSIAIASTYTAVAVLGYWRYGDNIKENIIDNLPQDHLLTTISKFLIGLAIYFTFALHSFVPCCMAWDVFIEKRLIDCDCRLTWMIFIRVFTVALSYVGAISLPVLGKFLNVIVSMTFTILGIGIPSLIEICVLHPNYGFLKWVLLKNLILIVIAIIGLITGLYVTVKSIVKSFQQEFTT